MRAKSLLDVVALAARSSNLLARTAEPYDVGRIFLVKDYQQGNSHTFGINSCELGVVVRGIYCRDGWAV